VSERKVREEEEADCENETVTRELEGGMQGERSGGGSDGVMTLCVASER